MTISHPRPSGSTHPRPSGSTHPRPSGSTKLTGPVRVRFPPSPTGALHVGGARTAIYNELLRHSLGGSLILRIEDTDRERSDPAMTEQIKSALAWLGIVPDEGPFLQSERIEAHRAAAARLLEEGKAYRCFRTAQELEEKREEAKRRGLTSYYRVFFSPPSEEEVARRLSAGEPYAVRFRMPMGEMRFHDLVRGEVVFSEDVLDDFIILRSDGSPTYHLSVCCDDADGGVTHVIRGEDHLSNVPKHIGRFQALGTEVPVFGHRPLIMGPDRKRLSKRTGAASVEEFRDQGILPQALFNFLALLGWSPGDGREVMSRREMIDAFTAERLVPSAAIFDYDKLRWMNAQYLSGEPSSEIMHHLEPFLAGVGLDGADPERLRKVVDLVRTRAYNLKELAAYATPYFQEYLDYDPELCRKFFAQPELPDQLDLLIERFRSLTVFDLEGIETAIRGLAKEIGIKAGVLIHPTRMALSASKAGPSLFHLVEVMGREAGLRHLGHFVAYLRENAEPAD